MVVLMYGFRGKMVLSAEADIELNFLLSQLSMQTLS